MKYFKNTLKEIKQFITSFDDIGFPFWFIIPGIFAVIIGNSRSEYAENSNTWPETEGQVISVSLEKSSSTTIKTKDGGYSGSTSYKPLIEYEYVVNGIKFKSSNLSFGFTSFEDYKEAQDIIDKYNPGQYVKVYYEPDNPQTAVLIRGREGIPTILIIGIVFLATCIPLFIIAVINKLKKLFIGKKDGDT